MSDYLLQFPTSVTLRLIRIHPQGLDDSILQEFREQGFLPQTEIRILRFYPSQKKIVVTLNETITIALPYSLAERIEVRKESLKN